MLVLSRKQGESIQIDDNIFVTVSEVKGGRVRLSIDAPRNVRIVRKEVLERDFGPAPESFVLDLPVAPSGDCLN
ncbi:MAG: carbon storage regulator [Planctomycetaceae bacterium]|nr:carbon storage regulator [Planctomycetaceae bacterium]